MSYKFLYEWQTLIGAFLGAATPISLWFFTQLYQNHRNYKAHLYNLEKLLVTNINSLIEAHRTIDTFINTRLPNLIQNIKQRNEQKIYSADYAFFPLFSASFPIDNIIDVNTKSGYVDNEVIHVLRMSKEFPVIIEDVRQQFMSTVQINKDISFNKLNSPQTQNQIYIENIENFIKFVREDMLEKDIKIYMRALISARLALNTIRNWGIIRWRLKFESHFKYFKNKKDLKKFRDDTHSRIDNFLKEKIDVEVEKMEALYKAP